jgi:hypothetical protein
MRRSGFFICGLFLTSLSGCSKKTAKALSNDQDPVLKSNEHRKVHSKHEEEVHEESVHNIGAEFEYSVDPKIDSLSFTKKSKATHKLFETLSFSIGGVEHPSSLDFVHDIFALLDAAALEKGKDEAANFSFSSESRGPNAVLVNCYVDSKEYVGAFYSENPAIVKAENPQFYKLCAEMLDIRKQLFPTI